MSRHRDAPAKAVAVAVSWMPAVRRDWGSAMAAELEYVEGSAARWRFAGGCLRVALTPGRPRSRRLAGASVVATLVILFSLANGPGPSKAGRWAAANLMVALTVYGLYLATAVFAQPRPVAAGSPDAPRGGGALRTAVFVGVSAALGLYAFVLLHYPEARRQGDSGALGYLATAIVSVAVVAIFAAYLWLAAARTGARSPAAVVARRYGLVAGSIAGPLLVAASYVSVPTVVIVAAAGTTSLLAGHLASRAGGDARTGLAAGLWAGIVAGLVLFVAGAGLVLATGGPSISPKLIADFHASTFHDLRSFSVAGSFGLDGDPPLIGALVPLVFVPLLFIGLASIGATRGDRSVTWRYPPPAA